MAQIVKTFLERVEVTLLMTRATKIAAFLKVRRDEILDLVGRAERLAQALQAQSPEFVVCHSDVHAGNILIDANDTLYIVDWTIQSWHPKARFDVHRRWSGFTGHNTAQEEESLFYRGYGQRQIDAIALHIIVMNESSRHCGLL